jgi:hypothetical protein
VSYVSKIGIRESPGNKTWKISELGFPFSCVFHGFYVDTIRNKPTKMWTGDVACGQATMHALDLKTRWPNLDNQISEMMQKIEKQNSTWLSILFPNLLAVKNELWTRMC